MQVHWEKRSKLLSLALLFRKLSIIKLVNPIPRITINLYLLAGCTAFFLCASTPRCKLGSVARLMMRMMWRHCPRHQPPFITHFCQAHQRRQRVCGSLNLTSSASSSAQLHNCSTCNSLPLRPGQDKSGQARLMQSQHIPRIDSVDLVGWPPTVRCTA